MTMDVKRQLEEADAEYKLLARFFRSQVRAYKALLVVDPEKLTPQNRIVFLKTVNSLRRLYIGVLRAIMENESLIEPDDLRHLKVITEKIQ